MPYSTPKDYLGAWRGLVGVLCGPVRSCVVFSRTVLLLEIDLNKDLKFHIVASGVEISVRLRLKPDQILV